jgi:excisionase family DNA binding protein
MLYSLEQIAERLGLHVRTVRSYVRSGRLKATRIGKQYRVAREDLDAFTGQAASPTWDSAISRNRYVEVSSIVQVDAISPDAMSRVSNLLLGAAKGRRDDDGPLRIETIYDTDRGRLKIIVVGGLQASTDVFKLIVASLET